MVATPFGRKVLKVETYLVVGENKCGKGKSHVRGHPELLAYIYRHSNDKHLL